MKQKLLFFAVLCFIGFAVKAQTNVFPTDGNVGIGTDSPQTKLEINGITRIKNGELQVVGDNINIGGALNIINTAKTGNGQASNWRIFNMGGGYGNSLQFWAYDNLGCTSGGMCAPRLTLMDNGNVGIGSTTPQAKLDIENNILIGLGEPAWGVRIKANFPNYNGGWSRGFFVANQDNSSNFIGLGAVGGCSNGIATIDRAWIGKDYDNSYMNFLPNGNVGVGTTNPQAKLDIENNILIGLGEPAWGVRIKANFPNYNGGWSRGFFVANQDNSSNFIGLGAVGGCSNGIATIDRAWIGKDYDNSYMNFLPNGNVGIGTTAPDQKLTVKGKIHAEEVIVDLNVPVADYVFAKDYDLMPLHKVEQYVKQNSHLPDIPSASEIKEQGLSMGEMQNKLLKKIEELTLYAIEQNKKMAQMEQRIKELETK